MATKTDILAGEFLARAQQFNASVKPVRVLRARVYEIAQANVLVRAASSAQANGRYFFGVNYITIEEIANLDNPFIAFVCGSVDNSLIVPAHLFFNNLSRISHDRNGEYKIIIDKDFNIVLKGRGNRINSAGFVNNWELLLKPFETSQIKSTAEESLHSVVQGRIIEIGNTRGFHTYSPDASRKFNNKKLSEFTSLDKCPDLQFSDYGVLRKIDVLWFSEKGRNIIPEYAFEVELSTGTWSGVGRLATLLDYSNVKLYVISNNLKRYHQAMHSFAEHEKRYSHILTEHIGDLYAAELQLSELRHKVGL